MAKKLTYWILGGLVLGVIVGWLINANSEGLLGLFQGWGWIGADKDAAALLAGYAHYISILTTIFLHLIKMIIAPLVLSTLVVGIAHMGDTAALGRVGAKALAWFICASLISLTLGLILVNLLKPGTAVGLPLPPETASSGVDRAAFDFATFVSHIFPESMIDAMASNSILQIVVFSLFLGVAITAVGEPARPLVRAMEGLAKVMLQVTDYVMRFAPFAVFAAVSATIAERGPAILGTYGYFMGSFYFGLLLLWTLLVGAAFLVVGRRTRLLVRYIRDPIVLAFSTASSEAAFPRTLEALDRFGVPPRIASFVLPLGYSFNLDGSMMYMTFASIFIAQAYGIDLSLGQEIAMLLTLMITSKGIAGVPRASLVVITATLSQFNIPEAGILLVLAIDHFLDMGRSATNVVGNAVASVVVAKWEGGFDPVEPADIEPPHAPTHRATAPPTES
jgi:Na+/H+-dicarboxylate symporter